MIKGIYTSASGMIPRIKRQEVIANNLANVSSAGFKQDTVFTTQLSKAERKLAPKEKDWQQPMIDRVYTNFEPGVFERTGNALDFAIDGDGFFRLQLPDGSTALTRAGSFMVTADGLLAFPGGALLVGEGGPIEVGNGTVEVHSDGTVLSNGVNVAQLVPVTVEDLSQLTKVGKAGFVAPEGAELRAVESASIHQGFVESSNVDVVKEMIEMIASFRQYEAGAKAMQSQDETLGHLFNRVGSSA